MSQKAANLVSDQLRSFQIAPEEIEVLRGRLLLFPVITLFSSEPKFAALMAALGIHQEVGTINDQLARFIYDADSGEGVPRDRIRSELVEYRGYAGVRIWVAGHSRLELKLNGIRELMHPTFSFNPDGTIKQCVFFPESVAKIARLQGVELVLVREWALNTIFGGFDRNRQFYETNAWELVQNDALRYSGLLANKQIAFLGTHDLAAHVAGVEQSAIDDLQALGTEIRQRFERYFGQMKRPSVYSLVLPYAAGVILDDLAQPRNYGAPGRCFVLEWLMERLDRKTIDPSKPKLLMRFPDAYEKLIQLARDTDLERIQTETPALCRALVSELNRYAA